MSTAQHWSEHPSSCWRTPPTIWDLLNKKYKFTLDVAADADNARCARFISREKDAFKTPWNGTCFCNPPYGGAKRGEQPLRAWYERALEQVTFNKKCKRVVMLVHCQMASAWTAEACTNATRVIFPTPRIPFLDHEGKADKNGNRGDNMILVFERHNVLQPEWSHWYWKQGGMP